MSRTSYILAGRVYHMCVDQSCLRFSNKANVEIFYELLNLEILSDSYSLEMRIVLIIISHLILGYKE